MMGMLSWNSVTLNQFHFILLIYRSDLRFSETVDLIANALISYKEAFKARSYPAFKCHCFWSFDLLEFLGLLTLQWFYRLFEYDLLYIFENLKCFSSVNLQLIRVWCKMKPLNLCKQGSSHYIIQHANEFCISKSPPWEYMQASSQRIRKGRGDK